MIKSTLKKALLIALAIIPMTFFGQRLENPSNYWSIGVEAGPTLLFADNDAWQLDQLGWDLDLNIGYTFYNTAYLYGKIGYASLKGKQGKNWEIDECKAIVTDLNIGVDILQLFSKNPGRIHAIVPHLGWGMIQHRTTVVKKNGKKVMTGYLDHNPGAGLGGRRPVMEVPMGVNFIFNFTKHFAANVDVVTCYTSTNWLDGIDRGKYDDWYSYMNFGVAYKFGIKDMSCPVCEECPEVTETDCSEAIKQAVEEALANCAPAEEEAPAEEVVEETEEEVVWEEKDINLAFKVNSSEVLKTQANAKEAKKVSDDIEAGREINTIKIVGYASPEGDEEDNMQLSEDRANATAEYIKERLGKKANGIKFETEGMGSDWDGFYEALSKSRIADKRQVEKQIMNSEDPTATLNQLRGKYSQLDEILNGLRRTEVFVK